MERATTKNGLPVHRKIVDKYLCAQQCRSKGEPLCPFPSCHANASCFPLRCHEEFLRIGSGVSAWYGPCRIQIFSCFSIRVRLVVAPTVLFICLTSISCWHAVHFPDIYLEVSSMLNGDFSSKRTTLPKVGEAMVRSCSCHSKATCRGLQDGVVWTNFLVIPAALFYFSEGWLLAGVLVLLSGAASFAFHIRREDRVRRLVCNRQHCREKFLIRSWWQPIRK